MRDDVDLNLGMNLGSDSRKKWMGSEGCEK